jgi:hypothetical protein
MLIIIRHCVCDVYLTTRNTHNTDIHPSPRQDSNPQNSKWADADTHLRTYWDWQRVSSSSTGFRERERERERDEEEKLFGQIKIVADKTFRNTIIYRNVL